jgi:hypothetical protein
MGIAWFSGGSDRGEDKGLGTTLERELTDILSPHGCIFHKLLRRLDRRSIYFLASNIWKGKVSSPIGVSQSPTSQWRRGWFKFRLTSFRKGVGNYRMCKNIKDSEKANISP